MNQPSTCDLNGCTNPVDPDSPVGRCAGCSAAVEVEVMRIFKLQQERRAAKTRRASVDAVLLAQAFHRGDDTGGQVIVDNADIHSVALQLCGYLFATLRYFDVDIDERLAVWLKQSRTEIGEPS
jgi:hypothetical protein